MIKEIGIKVGDRCLLRILKDGNLLYEEEMMFHKSFGYVPVGDPILNECSNDYVEISINQGSFCEQRLPELLTSYDLSSYKVEVHPLKVTR